jgi:hypothetical protein
MSELLGGLKLHHLQKRSRLVGSRKLRKWHMLSSSVTKEYDDAGSSECYPDVS